MKKAILSLIALLLIGTVTNVATAQVKFGLVGGWNVSKLSFDKSIYDSSNRSGWYVGPKIWFNVPIVGLGVNAAVEYSQRRLNGKIKDTGDAVSTSEYYKSIEIPVNVRYSLGLGSIASVYGETGPQFGFTVGDKTPGDLVKFNSSNVTWNVGLGVRLANHLEIGADYNIALSNFGKINVAGITVPKSDYKANSWQVQAAYLF